MSDGGQGGWWWLVCDHCGCRSFGAVAELTAEHEAILARAWRLAEAGDLDLRARLTDELLTVLDPHVEKEERGLYPLLLRDGDLEGDVAGDLEAEHRELRTSLLRGRFGRREYYALAAHVEQEEMELFPAAMFAFDDEAWDELDDVHRAVDDALPAAAV
jgi:hemerythrin-like domain-containing protein